MNASSKLEQIEKLMTGEVKAAYRDARARTELIFKYLTSEDIEQTLIDCCAACVFIEPYSKRTLKELDPEKPVLRFKFTDTGLSGFIERYANELQKDGFNGEQVVHAFKYAYENEISETDSALELVNLCYSLVVRDEFTSKVTAKLFDIGYSRLVEATGTKFEDEDNPVSILSSIFAIACQRNGQAVQVRMLI